MVETFLNKGILEKLTREGMNLTFYTAVNKLITYNNLRMYINLKSVH
jgi:hypothetical protein